MAIEKSELEQATGKIREAVIEAWPGSKPIIDTVIESGSMDKGRFYHHILHYMEVGAKPELLEKLGLTGPEHLDALKELDKEHTAYLKSKGYNDTEIEQQKQRAFVAALGHDINILASDKVRGNPTGIPEEQKPFFEQFLEIGGDFKSHKIKTDITDPEVKMAMMVFGFTEGSTLNPSAGGSEFASTIRYLKKLKEIGFDNKELLAVATAISGTIPFEGKKAGKEHFDLIKEKMQEAAASYLGERLDEKEANLMITTAVYMANRDISGFLLKKGGFHEDTGSLTHEEAADTIKARMMDSLKRANFFDKKFGEWGGEVFHAADGYPSAEVNAGREAISRDNIFERNPRLRASVLATLAELSQMPAPQDAALSDLLKEQNQTIFKVSGDNKAAEIVKSFTPKEIAAAAKLAEDTLGKAVPNLPFTVLMDIDLSKGKLREFSDKLAAMNPRLAGALGFSQGQEAAPTGQGSAPEATELFPDRKQAKG